MLPLPSPASTRAAHRNSTTRAIRRGDECSDTLQGIGIERHNPAVIGCNIGVRTPRDKHFVVLKEQCCLLILQAVPPVCFGRQCHRRISTEVPSSRDIGSRHPYPAR